MYIFIFQEKNLPKENLEVFFKMANIYFGMIFQPDIYAFAFSTGSILAQLRLSIYFLHSFV